MKKFLLLLSLSLFSLHLQAQENNKVLNVLLDTRGDFVTTFDKEGVQDNSFKAQTFRVHVFGEATPFIRYKIRHRLNESDNPVGSDNFAKATDYAFIEIDAGSDWTFKLGKQPIQFGTFEYDYNGADLYFTSLNVDDLDMYATGLNTQYRFRNQRFNFQIVNSSSTQFAVEKYRKKAFAFLFLWEGDLWNGMLKTRYSYGLLQRDKNKFNKWITLGTQLNLGRLIAELDLYRGEKLTYIEEAQILGIDYSLSLNLTYALGKFKPVVKGIWNYRKHCDTKEKIIDSSGIQFAMEYAPFEDPLLQDFRFHTAYFYSGDKASDSNQNTALAGIRWLLKIK